MIRMGMLQTRWTADYRGHALVVSRNEVTKGFSLSWDGVEIGRRTWSWVGLGTLSATAEIDGEPVEVHAAITWGGLSALDGKCEITVGGESIAVTFAK